MFARWNGQAADFPDKAFVMTLVSQAASLRANRLPAWTNNVPATSMPKPTTGKYQFFRRAGDTYGSNGKSGPKETETEETVLNTLTSQGMVK